MAVKVGTSSWTDPTLLKDVSFYPPGTSRAEDRLRYYASIYTAVEVDSTYYAPPNRTVAEAWVERTDARCWSGGGGARPSAERFGTL